MGLVGAELGVRPPWFRPLVRRPLFSLITRAAPVVAPFDAEVYLKHHFSKVGEQTRMMMRGYIESGDARGLPSGEIAELNARVFG